ncbi:MAG: type III-A CRISPR-associated RAMP protein Csm5 [Bifidobacteriaceae bacterium]|nr:type III-A CRISPR-associated RAMP protein Csm5 [Bifidobacteriaceae bacterium]
MSSYLKRYRLTLETVGPVFVGSGEKRTQKEYCVSAKKVYFPDMGRMYADIVARGKRDSFERFILASSRTGGGRRGGQMRAAQRLGEWLSANGWAQPDQARWGGYEVGLGGCEESKGRYDPGSRTTSRGKVPPINDIVTFMKDPYGNPYVPGSSIKGLLRTLLLEYLVNRKEKEGGRRDLTNPGTNAGRLEASFLRTLLREGTRSDNAVNDVLQALSVADGAPLRLSDLAICQKIDRNTKDSPAGLPLYRECLVPHLSLDFDITVNMAVNAQLCGKDLSWWVGNLANIAGELYPARYGQYVTAFRPAEIGLLVQEKGCFVYLGGGAGFRSKTVVNNQDVMAKILEGQFGGGRQRAVRHESATKRTGVSPLVVKLTKFRDRYYEMGKCSIAIEPLDQ